MTNRVSDETIDRLIEHWACGTWQTMDPVFANDNLSALTELRERREAERKAKEEKPEPDFAQWADLTCPKCGHEAVCLDTFGYRCLMPNCGWTKNEQVKP